jgi:hypothetical protein
MLKGPALHDDRRRIVRALHEGADVTPGHVAITVSGSSVMLTGSETWRQRDAAERSAAGMPAPAAWTIAVGPRSDKHGRRSGRRLLSQ